jgi:SAM-dependent methyltransferase
MNASENSYPTIFFNLVISFSRRSRRDSVCASFYSALFKNWFRNRWYGIPLSADARSFKFPQKYDAVFSTFNSLNHILRLGELYRAFKNVCKCLVSGGIFIFDLSTERHFREHLKNHKEIKEIPDCFYATHNDYNPEECLALFRFTIFRHKGGNWQQSDVTVQETFYPAAEVKSSLKKAGFGEIRAYSFSREHGLQKPTRNSFQIFYYARKP